YDCAIRFPFTQDISSELEETHKHIPTLLKEFNPRRPDTFLVDFYDEGATQEKLMRLINELDEGTTEIMCHPGYVDDAFEKESVYNKQRERELTILTDPSIREAIQANGISLITFAEL
ncbi:MAG TPA: ChbG/HpnK family deacetylase, partial [Anaerolineales bacterium]